MRSPVQGPVSTGVAALLQLACQLGSRLSQDEWREILLALEETTASTLPSFMKVLRTMDDIEIPNTSQACADMEMDSENGSINDDIEDDNLQTAAYVVSRLKSHISLQLFVLQVATDLYKLRLQFLSATNVKILHDIFSSIALHAQELNFETVLQNKLRRVLCSILELSDPPMVHFENESYQNYLIFLGDSLMDNPSASEELNMESHLVELCEMILQMYLNCTGSQTGLQKVKPVKQHRAVHMVLPLGSAKKEELAARTSLVVSALGVLGGLKRETFKKYVSNMFPSLIDLVRSEHGSREVQLVLGTMFQSRIGPIILQ